MMKEKSTGCPVVLVLLLILGLCAGAEDHSSKQRLESSCFLYRNGEYTKAIDSLTALLPAIVLRGDSLTALKYLAYSACMLGRTRAAKGYFKKLLYRFPRMEIDTLECPPRISLLFEQVKLEAAMARIDAASHPLLESPAQQRSGPAVPILLLFAAVGSAGASEYFLFNGNDLRKKYRAVGPQDPDTQSKLDKYYRASTTAYYMSAACAGVAAASIYLVVEMHKKKRQAKLSLGPGCASLVCGF